MTAKTSRKVLEDGTVVFVGPKADFVDVVRDVACLAVLGQALSTTVLLRADSGLEKMLNYVELELGGPVWQITSLCGSLSSFVGLFDGIRQLSEAPETIVLKLSGSTEVDFFVAELGFEILNREQDGTVLLKTLSKGARAVAPQSYMRPLQDLSQTGAAVVNPYLGELTPLLEPVQLSPVGSGGPSGSAGQVQMRSPQPINPYLAELTPRTFPVQEPKKPNPYLEQYPPQRTVNTWNLRGFQGSTPTTKAELTTHELPELPELTPDLTPALPELPELPQPPPRLPRVPPKPKPPPSVSDAVRSMDRIVADSLKKISTPAAPRLPGPAVARRPYPVPDVLYPPAETVPKGLFSRVRGWFESDPRLKHKLPNSPEHSVDGISVRFYRWRTDSQAADLWASVGVENLPRGKFWSVSAADLEQSESQQLAGAVRRVGPEKLAMVRWDKLPLSVRALLNRLN